MKEEVVNEDNGEDQWEDEGGAIGVDAINNFNYKEMMKEAMKRRAAAEFKSKIKSISFTKIPGGARDRK